MLDLTPALLEGLPSSERVPPSFLRYYVWAKKLIKDKFNSPENVKMVLLADDLWRVIMECWAYKMGNNDYKELREAKMQDKGKALVEGLELTQEGLPILGIIDDLHDSDSEKTVYRVSLDTGILKLKLEDSWGYIVRINTDDRELTLLFAYHEEIIKILEDLIKRVPALHVKREGIEVMVIGGNNIIISEKVSWDDLILDENVRKAIEYDIRFFLEKKDWFAERDIPRKRSWLFEGPPGNGKTSVIKLIAHMYGEFFQFKTVAFNAIAEPEVPKALSQLHKPYNSKKDVLAFIEDLDRTLKDPDTHAVRSLEPFLGFYDGVAGLDGMLIITTANRPELLDRDAMLGRKGRFDRHFTFRAPTSEDSFRFMKNLFNGTKVTDRVLETVSELPRSFSFFKELFITSATLAFDEEISDKHVLETLELDVPSGKMLDRVDKRIGPTSVDHITKAVEALKGMEVEENAPDTLLQDAGRPGEFEEE